MAINHNANSKQSNWGFPKLIPIDGPDAKKIKIFAEGGIDLTAEGLLNLCSPFGQVNSVQKTVKNGLTSGTVIFSAADAADLAMMSLRGTKGIRVASSDPGADRGTCKDERSERPLDPSLLQHGLSGMPPQGLPNLLQIPLASYNRNVFLCIQNFPKLIYQRVQVLRLLPPSAIDVQVNMEKVLVLLPDIIIALMTENLLKDLYTGSQRLHISFEFSQDRPAHRIWHRSPRALL